MDAYGIFELCRREAEYSRRATVRPATAPAAAAFANWPRLRRLVWCFVPRTK